MEAQYKTKKDEVDHTIAYRIAVAKTKRDFGHEEIDEPNKAKRRKLDDNTQK